MPAKELQSNHPPLEARGLHLTRGGKRILGNASLTLRKGELTVVIGPNGAGKSTLLKCLTGEYEPESGQVLLWGRPIDVWESEDLALTRAVLSQAAPLAFPFRVSEVVALGRLAHRFHSDTQTDSAAVDYALAQVGLKGFEDRRYTTLSGGEQQRTQLARVLAQLHGASMVGLESVKPLLFLDEPTSALDIRHQCRILGTARQLADEGHAVFAVLHDLNYALRFADRVILMREGRIVHDVASEHCDAGMLEDVFEIRLSQIPDTSQSGNNFYFPQHPKTPEIQKL